MDIQKQKEDNRAKHEEYQYLNLISLIINTGEFEIDRTNVGTYTLLGQQMRFSLSNNVIPVLTTKTVFWKGVVCELLWFLSGSTDVTVLKNKGVNIWNENSKINYLKTRNLEHKGNGYLGPIYSFQWRHFGADYVDAKTNYTNQGVDQIRYILDLLITKPNDRRIILSSWNPKDLPNMSLPPCHVMCHFRVINGYLSCMMTQRSCDMGLGIPFNIASYCLLTHLIAHACNLKPKEFIHNLDDAHIYKNHVKPLEEQLKNTPRPFPTLLIKKQKQPQEDPLSWLLSLTENDLILENYNPHPSIKMEMAV